MPGKFEDYLLSLQKLDECFSVLFPSVLDSEDAKTSTEDNEATATGAAVAAAANISETMNDENDDCEDVDWIDENENEVTVGSIYENEFEFSSGSGVPYALVGFLVSCFSVGFSSLIRNVLILLPSTGDSAIRVS